MRKKAITVMVAVILLAGAVIAQQKRQQDIDLQAAIRTETVDGDLNAAIKQYGAIAAKYKMDRATAASALVHIAECYQKMGDDQARKIYEEVLRNYSDQKDAAATATAYLGRARVVAPARGDRAVWTGPEVDLFGTISPDGRFLTYIDWLKTGRLMLRDLNNGTSRPLTKPSWLEPGPSGGADYSTISHDGSQVAYEWWDTGVSGDEIRIAPLQGGEFPPFRRLPRHDDVNLMAPYDWSPDGKWLAMFVRRTDLTGQIALMSTADGTLRVLKSVDWRGPSKIFFSPDGKYIAYDLAVDETTDNRHVFVMSSDGSRETVAVAHPSHSTVMGWSPDGRQLLFSSDVSGSRGLWAIPVEDGKAHGSASLVKADIGSEWSLGMTTSGALYVWKDPSATFVQVAPVDLTTGTLLAKPTDPATGQRFVASRGRPSWSPDGKFLTYTSCGLTGGGPCTIFVQTRETGFVREIHPRLSYFQQLRWSPDGRTLITGGTDLKGRRGVYLIDVSSGETSTVINRTDPSGYAEFGLNGQTILYRRRQNGVLVIMERDLTSGVEREVIRTPASGSFPVSVSPDHRYVASGSNEGPTSSLLLVPLGGGEPRELLRVAQPEVLIGSTIAWIPDGSAVIVGKVGADNRNELWLVPTQAGQPRKLAIDASDWNLQEGFRLRPDGKEIAFVGQAGKPGSEVWALENFLPASSAGR